MRRRRGQVSVLNNTSFLDAMANSVGALAFLLLMVVVVTVTLKLGLFDMRVETEVLPPAVVGEPYDVVLAVTGGNEPYEWHLVEGAAALESLGLGFEIQAREAADLAKEGRRVRLLSGRILGTPVRATEEPVMLTFVVDDTPVEVPEAPSAAGAVAAEPRVVNVEPATRRLLLTVKPRALDPVPLRVQTARLPLAVLGRNYAVHLAAEGGVPPYRWTVDGSLPSSMNVPPGAGVLRGSPREEGTWEIGLLVTDAVESQARRDGVRLVVQELRPEREVLDGVLAPLVVLTDLVPPARVGRPYDLRLAAEGGVPPYEWLLEGDLPDGLNLTTDGRIRGTPRRLTPSHRFAVRVGSSPRAPEPEQARQDLELTVEAAPAPIAPLVIP